MRFHIENLFLKACGALGTKERFQEGARKIKPIILNMLGQGDLRWSQAYVGTGWRYQRAFRVHVHETLKKVVGTL